MSIRRDSFEEMDRLFEQMRRSMMRGMAPMGYDFDVEYDADPSAFSTRTHMGSRRDINLTLEEADEGYVVIADLPGFETEEIDLRLDGETLIIAAEHDVEEESEGMHRASRRSIHERMRVPGDVVEDEISATYRNGVLEVTLPVREEPRDEGRSIDIN